MSLTIDGNTRAAGDSQSPSYSVFISYCRSDRHRVNGLEQLLKALGHEMFLDYKSIRLGARWKNEILHAVDNTQRTLVYWTRAAATSEWVKKGYEYILGQKREVIPILGDDTPLPQPLKEHQALDFIPIVNELLEVKRSMQAEGRKASEIRDRIRERLKEANIRLEEPELKKVLRFLGVPNWIGLSAFILLLSWIWRSMINAVTHLTPAQTVLVVSTAASATFITAQVLEARLHAALSESAQLKGQINEVREELKATVKERDVRYAYMHLEDIENKGIIAELEALKRRLGEQELTFHQTGSTLDGWWLNITESSERWARDFYLDASGKSWIENGTDPTPPPVNWVWCSQSLSERFPSTRIALANVVSVCYRQ